MPSRTLHIALLSAASLLASGCYCPMLSGRYCDPRCCPPCILGNTPCCVPPVGRDETASAADGPPSDCSPPCAPLHRRWLSRLFPGLAGGEVPSQQGPDYLSPQPKFHPVPTRPVFEPQLAYPPPQLIESAGASPPANPLRSAAAHVPGDHGAVVRPVSSRTASSPSAPR